MRKNQNFIKRFGENLDGCISESVRIPCIVLFYPYSVDGSRVINYCHFDENNLYELKAFVDSSADEGLDKIALFGGYGSENIVPLMNFIKEKGLDWIVDKDFVSAPPIDSIGINEKGLSFGYGNGLQEVYSYDRIGDVFELE